uniref:Zinc knuckle CX2CX4HX4C n=1 Tax=Tanacetum cinerariifolium TaxID=118510 RepID=A0A6L2J324_TANCI|nr:hypothetical protein [Tanacetum cinerariifolium]
MNRQLLDSQGPIPGMTHVQALTTIQTMSGHSQKWHDGSSSRSIEGSSSEGIAAIMKKLKNLGRDIKKLKENVHAIQVGCQTCGGAHLDKDCPLKEEVKSIKEAKYGEFERPLPFSNKAKYRVGPPGYYTRMDNRPPVGEKRQSLEELMNKHLEESMRRRTDMEEWDRTKISVFIIRIRGIGVEMIGMVQGQQCVRRRKVFRFEEFRIHKGEMLERREWDFDRDTPLQRIYSRIQVRIR